MSYVHAECVVIFFCNQPQDLYAEAEDQNEEEEEEEFDEEEEEEEEEGEEEDEEEDEEEEEEAEEETAVSKKPAGAKGCFQTNANWQ